MGGQIIVFYLVFIIPMAMLMFSIYNVGQLTTEKMKLQTAADNAAYSGAVWEARYMNLEAYINRAMVANYDTMAMMLSFWSMFDSFDGFMGLLHTVVEVIPIIGQVVGPILQGVHHGVHIADTVVSKVIGGSSQQKALLYVMETYIKILSYAQEAMYFVNQAGRTSVIQSIAWGVDPKIQYLGLAEFLNALSLNSRVKWDGLNSSNHFNEDKALRQTITRSLNEFSRGESFRDLGSDILAPVNLVLKPFDFICSLIGVGLSISIGPTGYDVTDFDEVTGKIGAGPCKDGCDKDQIVRLDRLYQHDFTGIRFKACVVTINLGHHSDDNWNVGGPRAFESTEASVAPPHLVDDVLDTPDGQHDLQGIKNFTDNGIQCSSIGASLGNPAASTNNCGRVGQSCGFSGFDSFQFGAKVQSGQLSPGNAQAQCANQIAQDNDCTCPDFSSQLATANSCGQNFTAGCSSSLQSECGLPQSKINQYQQAISQATQQGQPAPDLSSQISSDCQASLMQQQCTSNQQDQNGQTQPCQLPQNVGGSLASANQCSALAQGGPMQTPNGLNTAGQSLGSGERCATIYMFDTKLPDVKMTTFVRDSDIDPSLDGRRLQGPTVFVYFEKPAANLPLFVGTNIYPQPLTLGAYSFAKVYYTRRPGDTAASPGSGNPRVEGKETLFNPFWAARLELPKVGGQALLH